MKGSVLSHLIIEINDITKIENDCNVLLSGKIYEYFIGRDESAISELGAYFTDRHIVDYILNKLNPCINDDGTISSMIDMFGGSGGFTTGYINYLNEKYKNGEINWETEINKINHFDMNEDVIKSAGLEIFCLTGTLPNMNNLRYKNSFRDEFNDTKYKYPITNPPYGGDKNKKSTAQEKRDKIKEYIKKDLINITDEGIRIARQKQLKDIEKQEKVEKKDNNKTKVCLENCSGRIQKYAYDNKLKGSDKEACSLILLMDILEVGGTAIGVLKEGVFFNNSYKDLRKCLIEKYNVREIISVPSDQFENTSTKTSIIIFDNIEEKTSEVKFYDLVVERFTEDKFIEKNGNIFIVQNKGDISGVSDTLVSVASREEVLSNPIYSLNGKDYNKKVIVCGEGYELVKIGDITDINIGSTPYTQNYKYWDNGTFIWVSISDMNENIIYKTKKCLTEEGVKTMSNRKVPKGSILLSFKLTIGKLAIAGCDLYCNEAIAYLNSKITKIPQMFLYYILDSLNLEKYGRGTIGSNGNLNKEILKDIQIPIPKSEQKIIEWVDKISKPYDEKNTKTNKIKELEEYVKNKIKDIGENEECDEFKLEEILIRKNNGRTNTNDVTNIGIYPFYSATAENPSGITNKNDFDGENYLLFAKSGGSSKTIFGNTLGIGKFWLVSGKSAGNVAMIKFEINKDFNIKYIYYYLKYKLFEIQKLALYSTGNGNIQVEDMLKKFKIKIPKNKQHIKDLEPTFDEIEKLQGEVKEAETLYNNLIKELSDEAMPKTSAIIELTKENVDTFEEITEVKEEKVPSIKSSVASSVASGTSIKSLKEQCKSLGIKGYSNKKKDELIKLIENHK
jgi:type I restriction enzyme S subunit